MIKNESSYLSWNASICLGRTSKVAALETEDEEQQDDEDEDEDEEEEEEEEGEGQEEEEEDVKEDDFSLFESLWKTRSDLWTTQKKTST